MGYEQKGLPYAENPDSKIHGANMGPTWVLSAPDGPHVGPMDLAIRDTGHCIWQNNHVVITQYMCPYDV